MFTIKYFLDVSLFLPIVADIIIYTHDNVSHIYPKTQSKV